MLDGGSSEGTKTIDECLIKLEPSNSDTETLTDIQNYLDLFNKEIEGNDVPQVQTGKYFCLRVNLYFNKNNKLRCELRNGSKCPILLSNNYKRWPVDYDWR